MARTLGCLRSSGTWLDGQTALPAPPDCPHHVDNLASRLEWETSVPRDGLRVYWQGAPLLLAFHHDPYAARGTRFPGGPNHASTGRSGTDDDGQL
jgi:hypothetical protein